MNHVLIVDDCSVDRHFVGRLLERQAQLAVEYAVSVDDALSRLERDPPIRVIVSDLMMPRRDGLDLLASLSATSRSVPVVLMTSRGSEEIAVRALHAGAASYVPKDRISELIVDTVRRMLAVSQQEIDTERLLATTRQLHCHFSLGNDTSLISPLLGFLNRGIRGLRLCDEATILRICVAVEEALTNAIVHGNLEITSAQRNDGDQYLRLLESRRATRPYSQREVHVEVELSPQRAQFTIEDQGPGFDPSTLPDPRQAENLNRLSGRGLLLMRTFMDAVDFNPQGNRVTLTKHRAAPVGTPS